MSSKYTNMNIQKSTQLFALPARYSEIIHSHTRRLSGTQKSPSRVATQISDCLPLPTHNSTRSENTGGSELTLPATAFKDTRLSRAGLLTTGLSGHGRVLLIAQTRIPWGYSLAAAATSQDYDVGGWDWPTGSS